MNRAFHPALRNTIPRSDSFSAARAGRESRHVQHRAGGNGTCAGSDGRRAGRHGGRHSGHRDGGHGRGAGCPDVHPRNVERPVGTGGRGGIALRRAGSQRGRGGRDGDGIQTVTADVQYRTGRDAAASPCIDSGAACFDADDLSAPGIGDGDIAAGLIDLPVHAMGHIDDGVVGIAARGRVLDRAAGGHGRGCGGDAQRLQQTRGGRQGCTAAIVAPRISSAARRQQRGNAKEESGLNGDEKFVHGCSSFRVASSGSRLV